MAPEPITDDHKQERAGERDTLAERVTRRLAGGALSRSPVSAHAATVPVHEPKPKPAAIEPIEGAPEPQAAPLVMDFSRLQALGFITPNAPPNQLTEAFRMIKRQLLQNAFPGGGRAMGNGHVIMITSSAPGEGKTFTALNLAMSLSAERDIHVLLVDGDSYHRSLARHLEAGDAPGLVDLLIEPELQLRQCLLRTNIPNLAFLPSGRQHPNATELLASKHMARLMVEIAARYNDRVIIVDTPPVLARTEAVVLGAHVGQTVVVVAQNRTKKQDFDRTLSLLGGCPNVSCIFTMATDDIGFPGYDYNDHCRQ